MVAGLGLLVLVVKLALLVVGFAVVLVVLW